MLTARGILSVALSGQGGRYSIGARNIDALIACFGPRGSLRVWLRVYSQPTHLQDIAWLECHVFIDCNRPQTPGLSTREEEAIGARDAFRTSDYACLLLPKLEYFARRQQRCLDFPKPQSCLAELICNAKLPRAFGLFNTDIEVTQIHVQASQLSIQPRNVKLTLHCQTLQFELREHSAQPELGQSAVLFQSSLVYPELARLQTDLLLCRVDLGLHPWLLAAQQPDGQLMCLQCGGELCLLLLYQGGTVRVPGCVPNLGDLEDTLAIALGFETGKVNDEALARPIHYPHALFGCEQIGYCCALAHLG